MHRADSDGLNDPSKPTRHTKLGRLLLAERRHEMNGQKRGENVGKRGGPSVQKL